MLLVIVGLLTGAVITLVITKVTHWFEVLILGGWGVLAAAVVFNGDLAALGSDIASIFGGA
jgi:hypothetical protein